MKKMELRTFLRVAHFAVVEKDGTVWVERNGIWPPQKSKNASKDAGATRRKVEFYLGTTIR
jgi:hypothetical protein